MKSEPAFLALYHQRHKVRRNKQPKDVLGEVLLKRKQLLYIYISGAYAIFKYYIQLHLVILHLGHRQFLLSYIT